MRAVLVGGDDHGHELTVGPPLLTINNGNAFRCRNKSVPCVCLEAAGVRYTVRTKQGKPDRLWYVEVQYDLREIFQLPMSFDFEEEQSAYRARRQQSARLGMLAGAFSILVLSGVLVAIFLLPGDGKESNPPATRTAGKGAVPSANGALSVTAVELWEQ